MKLPWSRKREQDTIEVDWSSQATDLQTDESPTEVNSSISDVEIAEQPAVVAEAVADEPVVALQLQSLDKAEADFELESEENSAESQELQANIESPEEILESDRSSESAPATQTEEVGAEAVASRPGADAIENVAEAQEPTNVEASAVEGAPDGSAEVDAEVEQSPPAAAAEVVAEANYDDPVVLLAAIEDTLSDLEHVLEEARVKCSAAGENFRDHSALRDALNSWLDERSSSFAWQLQASVSGEAQRAVRAEGEVRDWAKEPIEIPRDVPHAMRRRFHRRFSVASILVSAALFALMYYRHPIGLLVGLTFGGAITLPMIGLWLLASLVLSFFGSLTAYYRDWTRHEASLITLQGQGKQLLDDLVHFRAERARLEAMCEQVSTFLQTVAVGVYQPWLVSDDLGSFTGDLPDLEVLPAYMDIATPLDVQGPEVRRLERMAVIGLVDIGWRFRAYSALVEAVAEEMGDETLTLASIDEDTGFDGARNLFVTNLAARSVRERVGTQLALALAQKVQGYLLTDTRPPVKSLRPDPLEGLEVDNRLVNTEDIGIKQWDEFLGEVLAPGSRWTPNVLTTKGGAAIKRVETTSTVFVPERFAPRTPAIADVPLPVPPDSNVRTEYLTAEGIRPTDVAIRVDYSAWLEPDDLVTFTDAPGVDEDVVVSDSAQTPSFRTFGGV